MAFASILPRKEVIRIFKKNLIHDPQISNQIEAADCQGGKFMSVRCNLLTKCFNLPLIEDWIAQNYNIW